MKKIKVFLDSDVVISSLLSSTGAAKLLIENRNLIHIISNYSEKELIGVTKNLNINPEKLQKLIETKFLITKIKSSHSIIKLRFAHYATDINNAHTAAGAAGGKTSFLITYNTKHYRIDLIKKDFAIITHRPATFLQYLRSLKEN